MMYIWLILGSIILCDITNIYLLPRQSPAVRAAWSLFWTLVCAAAIAFMCYHFYDFLLIALPVACIIGLTAWWQQRKQPRRQWGRILIWALMFAAPKQKPCWRRFNSFAPCTTVFPADRNSSALSWAAAKSYRNGATVG